MDTGHSNAVRDADDKALLHGIWGKKRGSLPLIDTIQQSLEAILFGVFWLALIVIIGCIGFGMIVGSMDVDTRRFFGL